MSHHCYTQCICLFWREDRIRLFVYYTISLSSLCKLYLKTLKLWNVCQISFVEFVIKIKHILSVIHYTVCGMCVLSLAISFVMIEIIYIICLIIIIKSEVWSITHCLGLGHETMVCAVCLFIVLQRVLLNSSSMSPVQTVFGLSVQTFIDIQPWMRQAKMCLFLLSTDM